MARISDLDCARCAVLEADPVKALVEVDGVLPGHHLQNRDIYIYYWPRELRSRPPFRGVAPAPPW